MYEPRYYSGRGISPEKSQNKLPTVDRKQRRDPGDYLAAPDLAAAVDVALTLGMPLLLTGEPGSGKSDLAYSLAWEMGLDLKKDVLSFVVKSNTESRDLFYRFDTVGRFHASQTEKQDKTQTDPARFITFEAIGKAILLAKTKETVDGLKLPDSTFQHPGEPKRTIVLIDEIDKAPRDVPNDIIVEIENMQFDIPELAGSERDMAQIKLTNDDIAYWPIIIFTSNSEKALPEPFLRRCVYHHVEFPPFEIDPKKNNCDGVTVENIIKARFGKRYTDGDQKQAIDFLHYLRDDRQGLERRPTLAEFLSWLDLLMPEKPNADRSLLKALNSKDADGEAGQRLVQSIACVLLKKRADHIRARQLFEDWRTSAKQQASIKR